MVVTSKLASNRTIDCTPATTHKASPVTTTSKPFLCTKRTIENCIYDYEDLPGVSEKDCPPIPVLPASCGGGPTSTPQPAPTPKLSDPVAGSQECFSRSYAGGGLIDVNPGAQLISSYDYCQKYKDVILSPSDTSLTAFAFNDAPIAFDVQWIPGCKTTAATQSFDQPLPGFTCQDVMQQNFLACNNGGAGGTRNIGCVRYVFTGNEPLGVTPVPANGPPDTTSCKICDLPGSNLQGHSP